MNLKPGIIAVSQLLVVGCVAGADIDAPIDEAAFYSIETECDVGAMSKEARRRLDEGRAKIPSEFTEKMVAQETNDEVSFWYSAYATEDPDAIFVRAGGRVVVFDKKTCDHLRTEIYR